MSAEARSFRLDSPSFEAVQVTAENIEDVVAWVKANGGDAYTQSVHRNYTLLTVDDGECGMDVDPTDWVAHHDDGRVPSFYVYDDDEFKSRFVGVPS